MRPRLPTLAAALLCATLALGLVLPAAGDARLSRAVVSRLWATINICDTDRYPSTVGVRANTASTSRRDVLYLRYRLEFWSPPDNSWLPLRVGGDSGLLRVGRGRFPRLQHGYTFPVTRPSSGVFSFRAKVHFEWRRRGRVLDRITLKTRSGKPARGSDPPGYSVGVCDIAAETPENA